MRKIFTGSVGLLALLLITLLTCPGNNTTQAEDLTTSQSLETTARVTSRPALSVALSPVVDIDITPRSTGSYSSATAELTVSTNSRDGFSVLMNAVDGTNLTSSRNPSSFIASTSEPATLANLENNTWGYYIGEQAPDANSEFQSIPSTPTTIKETSTSTSDQTYKLALGTKIDTSLEAGTYSNSLLVSVVANPVEISGLQDLYYMQDITPEICASAPEGTETQLVDSRDGNKYWVAKLKDGNCWMTQNLDLYLDKIYTDADTDLVAGTTYTPSTVTNTIPLNGATVSTAVTNQWSWDVGKVTLALPTYGTACDATAISGTETYSAQVARQCGNVGVVDVSDANKFKPTYQATTNGSWTLPDGNTVDNTIVTVNCTEWSNTSNGQICTAGTYDAHYLLGNYYQWLAVTAGTASKTSKDSDVPSSICPKGWRLARTAPKDFSNKSWGNLLKQYGFVTNATQGQSSGNQTTTTIDGKTYSIFSEPIYFGTSGAISNTSAKVSGLSLNGTQWSSGAGIFEDRPGYSNIAHTLGYTTSTIIPSGAPSSTLIGATARCVNR